LTEAIIPVSQKKNALNRLVKDNVALIVVLEAKFGSQAADNPGKRQLLCVVSCPSFQYCSLLSEMMLELKLCVSTSSSPLKVSR
jgi:hypothetical protein